MNVRHAAAEIEGLPTTPVNFPLLPFFKTHAQPERGCL